MVARGRRVVACCASSLQHRDRKIVSCPSPFAMNERPDSRIPRRQHHTMSRFSARETSASSAIIFCGYRRRHARPVRSATWRKRGAARLFGRRLRHADTRTSRTTRVHASGLTRSRMPEEALRELLAAPPPMRRRCGGSRLTVGGVSPSASRRAAVRPCARARDRPASCGCHNRRQPGRCGRRRTCRSSTAA